MVLRSNASKIRYGRGGEGVIEADRRMWMWMTSASLLRLWEPRMQQREASRISGMLRSGRALAAIRKAERFERGA